jgi:hypothetical protein
MGFRRSPDRIAAAQHWRHFVERNAAVVDAAGLPPSATSSIDDWDGFVMHGFLRDDPSGFSASDLSDTQYSSLLLLVASYFHEGYEFYTPGALRIEDQEALRARYDRSQ